MSETLAYSSLIVSCLTPLAVVLVGHRLLQQLQGEGRERLLLEKKMALWVDLLTHAKKVHEAAGTVALLTASTRLLAEQFSRTNEESRLHSLEGDREGLQKANREALKNWGSEVSDFSEKCLVATVLLDENDTQVNLVSDLMKTVISDRYQGILEKAQQGPIGSETLEESTLRFKVEIEASSDEYLRNILIPKFKSLQRSLLGQH